MCRSQTAKAERGNRRGRNLKDGLKNQRAANADSKSDLGFIQDKISERKKGGVFNNEEEKLLLNCYCTHGVKRQTETCTDFGSDLQSKSNRRKRQPDNADVIW